MVKGGSQGARAESLRLDSKLVLFPVDVHASHCQLGRLRPIGEQCWNKMGCNEHWPWAGMRAVKPHRISQRSRSLTICHLHEHQEWTFLPHLDIVLGLIWLHPPQLGTLLNIISFHPSVVKSYQLKQWTPPDSLPP